MSGLIDRFAAPADRATREDVLVPQGRKVPDEVREAVVGALITGGSVSVVARDFGLARITVDRIATAAGIAPARGTTGPQRPEGLVDRDAEILRLAAAGEHYAEIGRRFRLSRERIRFIGTGAVPALRSRRHRDGMTDETPPSLASHRSAQPSADQWEPWVGVL